MTVGGILAAVDGVKPNRFDRAQKIRWLAELDGTIWQEIIGTHEDADADSFEAYDEATGDDQELLAPEPYSMVYRWWLEAQMDLANGELGKYQNSMQLYNASYLSYMDWYNRTHMPKQRVPAFRL